MASSRQSSGNRRLISARVLFLANFLFTVFTTVMIAHYLDGRQNRSLASCSVRLKALVTIWQPFLVKEWCICPSLLLAAPVENQVPILFQ
jgi:hypothetical protein